MLDHGDVKQCTAQRMTHVDEFLLAGDFQDVFNVGRNVITTHFIPSAFNNDTICMTWSSMIYCTASAHSHIAYRLLIEFNLTETIKLNGSDDDWGHFHALQRVYETKPTKSIAYRFNSMPSVLECETEL